VIPRTQHDVTVRNHARLTTSDSRWSYRGVDEQRVVEDRRGAAARTRLLHGAVEHLDPAAVLRAGRRGVEPVVAEEEDPAETVRHRGDDGVAAGLGVDRLGAEGE
jgi:hypothetical protein